MKIEWEVRREGHRDARIGLIHICMYKENSTNKWKVVFGHDKISDFSVKKRYKTIPEAEEAIIELIKLLASDFSNAINEP
jgi:hypothetical protein